MSVETIVRPGRAKQTKKPRPKQPPKYHVMLWDDNDHTYDYVIRMMQSVFGHTRGKAFQIACQVDGGGKAICLTTTKEHAELKRDQIHAFGKDEHIDRCSGSMWATLEQAT